MKPKILNCPHCGGKPWTDIVILRKGTKTYQITCGTCGCRTMAFDNKTWSKPRAEAIRRWNKRLDEDKC